MVAQNSHNLFFLTEIVKYKMAWARMELGERAMTRKGPDDDAPSDPGDPRRPPVRVELASLLAGGREAIIVHNGEDYRLRVTANGKLILTK
jgi:hemin uptake protein HemP